MIVLAFAKLSFFSQSKFQAHLAFVETEEDVDIALTTLKRGHKIMRAYNMYAYRFKARTGDHKSADLGRDV